MASSIFVNPSSTGGSSSTVALADGSVGAPSLSFLTAPTTGLFLSGGSPHLAIAGADSYIFGASTFNVPADIIVPSTNSLRFGTAGTLLSGVGVNGQANLTDNAQLNGVGFNVLTDSLLKIRTRAQTGNAALSMGVDGIAAVSTDGEILANDTAATVGVPVQMGPRHRWRSHVLNTTGNVDNTDDWIAETLPTSSATPSSFFKLGNSLNGAAYTYPMTLSPAGNMTILGSYNAGGGVNMAQSSHLQWGGTRADMASPADGQINLLTASQVTGVGVDVATDTILKIRTRAQTGYATVDALAYRASGVAGVSFGPSVLTSITIVNGIVTAAS